MSHLNFRLANTLDIEHIANLVNSAYRGDSSRVGWTTEADLLDGQRTDTDEISSLIESVNSVILLGVRDKEIITSLHLQQEGRHAHLGMFAIQPGLQGAGIGKLCLQQAENLVQQLWGVTTMQMAVITLRLELIAYYERRGYRNTGLLQPFPTSPRFGIPRVAGLQLTLLEKSLNIPA